LLDEGDDEAARLAAFPDPVTSMLRFAALLAAFLAPTLAHAHVGVGEASGLAAGLVHPLGGADHLLAMVAVGLLAAALGGRALWLVPASFLGMMAVGGALGAAGVAVPFVEAGIALSVVVLGLGVALGGSVPLAAACALAGGFAIFHGHAHGAEMPETASGLAYGAGFVAATALLHLAGLAVGLTFGRAGPTRLASRVLGGGFAVAGLALLAGVA
jgi:urease accessory protein